MIYSLFILYFSSLLITRQTAQLVYLGCKINNSAVHVTVNKCTYATITNYNCKQKVTVCMCYIKMLAIVCVLQLLIKLWYVCYNH